MTVADYVPLCTILAGPNGSGKSTVFADLAPAGELVNADNVARRLNPDRPEMASSAAGREVLLRLDELIEHRQNFTYETTLSSNQSLSLMARARSAGFRVELVFIVLKSPDMNIARVKTRVSQGGHDIPTGTIMRRYDKALAKLSKAIRLAHQVIIYDNTTRELVTPLQIDGTTLAFGNLDRAQEHHNRIARSVAAALAISTEAVLRPVGTR